MFLGGPTETVRKMGIGALAHQMQADFKAPVPALDAVPQDSTETFFWGFHDCRTSHWHRGRVVLLGDAAAGFLPTAGVGASMAMESAAALDDELSRVDAERVPLGLALYEKRHRKRVEKAQNSSRRLGRMMFVASRPTAWMRNQVLGFYTVEQLVRDIAGIMEEPI